ncbi:MAG: hypothetical protein K9L32_00415 [Chromatiaceae bacterium]|nr:hypothetical protein [Chromatiaceae bacterium]MCF8002668.1 hypothetical protein [Chromatiaceae bacterium]
MATALERRIERLEHELLMVDEPEDFLGCLITPRALKEIIMAVQGTTINPGDDSVPSHRQWSMD